MSAQSDTNVLIGVLRREISRLTNAHFDEVTTLRKERNEAHAKIRTLSWQLANCGIVAAMPMPDEAEHNTDGDNAVTGLESGKALNPDEVANAAKHADANLLGSVIDQDGKRVVLVMSRGFSKSIIKVGAPEIGSPANLRGETEYQMEGEPCTS